MKILITFITILILLQISCSNDNIQSNANYSEIREIEYKIFNPFIGLTQKITAFPNELKYYEKSWVDSAKKWAEKDKKLSLSSKEWNNLINSFDLNEFNNLKDFYEYPDSVPLMDADTISIEVRTGNRTKKVSYYGSSKNITAIDSLEKILNLFLQRFE